MNAAAKRKPSSGKNTGSVKAGNDKPGVHNHGTERSRPWALLAICVFMLFLLLSDNWRFEISSQFVFAVGSCIIFTFTFMFKENRQVLSKKIPVLMIVLTAQCALYFISLFYAAYPKFALGQFYLNTGALLIFAAAYVSLARSTLNIKAILKLLSCFIAAACLINIELATGGLLRFLAELPAFLLKATIPVNYGVFETNTRITTTLGVPNVFAPIAVFGMFISIWNFGKPEERSKRSFIYLALAIISGTAFVLCFSIGTILSYAVAFVVFFMITAKGDRAGQLLVHLFCLAVSLLGASVVFALRDVPFLPILTVLIVSFGASLIYTRIKPIRLPAIGARTKRMLFAGAAAVLIAFGICALLLTGPCSLSRAEGFRRAVALQPGDYSFTASYDSAAPDAAVTVEISSMSYAEAALKERTILATAKLRSGEAVSFSVPQSAAAVFVNVSAGGSLRVTDAVIQDGSTVKHLPLRYLLLPEFIVNRLQGLWVNDNAMQRFIFFRDGIRIGLKSPVFGLGGGAFEGAIHGVSDYYYETRHSHNEYIERFAEGGILGAALFVGFTVFVFRGFLKARRKDKANPMLPLLMALMVMIFIHAFLEVDFLLGSFRIASAVLFALAAAAGDDVLEPGKKTRIGMKTAVVLLASGAAVLAAGQYIAKKTLDNDPSLQSLQAAITYDPMNRSDYKLSYLLSTQSSDKQLVNETQEKYLNSMENSVVGYEARAQFLLLKASPDYDRGIAYAEAYIRLSRVKPEAWDTIFSLYNTVLEQKADDAAVTAKLTSAIGALCDYLQELNKTLPKNIETELAAYSYQRAANLAAGAADTLVDSRIPTDLNQDGIHDLQDRAAGDELAWQLKLPLSGPVLIKIYQPAAAAARISLNGSLLESVYEPEEGCYYAITKVPLTDSISEISIKTDASAETVYFTIEKTR